MTFGEALAALKSGQRVTRHDWPTGVWLVLVPGSTITVSEGRPLGDAAPELVGEQIQYQPHIDKMGYDGEIGPWYPTLAALLAEDWRPVIKVAP